MIKPLLNIILIICFFSCSHKSLLFGVIANDKINTKKAKPVLAIDTTKMIIDWYDFYVKHSIPKKIELIELPFEVNLNNKSYFDYQEVIQYYTQNYDEEKINSFKNKNSERIGLLKRTIANSNTLYSTNPQSAPKGFKVENFDNDYLCYYYNKSECNFGNDIISNVACVDGIERKILANLYGIDTSIETLIFSTHYNSSNNDSNLVPETLKNLVLKALSNTKSLLNQDEYEKVKNFNLSFEKRDVTLWVRTSGNTIYISPFIIRAAFLYSIGESKTVFDWYYSYKNNLPSLYRIRTEADISDVNGVILRRFMESFYFIFGHELAHEYLNRRSKDIATEKVCDCFSYKHIGYYKPGLYITILKKSIDNGYSQLWGVSSAGDLIERFNYLNILHSNSGAIICDQ